MHLKLIDAFEVPRAPLRFQAVLTLMAETDK